MDWSHLKSLELTDVKFETFMNQMDGELPSLKHLQLVPAAYGTKPLANETSHFMTNLAPFESLSLYLMTDHLNLTDILIRHGDSLRSLELREWEPEWQLRPVLSPYQLRKINQQCPSLTNLSIDINRNGTWPHRILDAVSSFENVSTLSLNLELGIDQHTDEWFHYAPPWARNITEAAFRQPVVNNNSSVELIQVPEGQEKGRGVEKIDTDSWGLGQGFWWGIQGSGVGGDVGGDTGVWCA